MKTFLVCISLVILTITSFFAGFWYNQNQLKITSNLPQNNIKEKLRPLDKYTIDALSQRPNQGKDFKIISSLTAKTTPPTGGLTKPTYTSHLFSYTTDKQKVTGQINIPEQAPKGVILMIRGYVDPHNYTTGEGTRNAAAVFAQNGFTTIAPDFLGYAGSDQNSADTLESRFQTYTTILDLLGLIKQNYPDQKILLWAHSNGGHIAITILEITKDPIPTVLWAPVTKPFPYSVLYYTDESEDKGKFLRKEIAKFEENYDSNLYSLDNYLNYIQAPIELHQGTADMAVPVAWSNTFVANLKKLDKKITYFTYPGTDHNLKPSWNLAVSRSLQFYQNHIK